MAYLPQPSEDYPDAHRLPQHQPQFDPGPTVTYNVSTSDPMNYTGAPTSLATPPDSAHSLESPADHAGGQLPKAGQTRCYWSLLSADLEFIYLDPMLALHLETEATLLVGKSLLAFVHPDERRTAEQDISNVLDAKALHGSVTRVRFLRFTSVRQKLNQSRSPSWTEADQLTSEGDYLAVDLVINWAADGLVLCFIHASEGLSPSDIDQQCKSESTSWCETPVMSHEEIELLLSRLLVCIPQTGNMNRVFQILANRPDRQLLLSWPPGPIQSSEASRIDFAKLVDAVNLDFGAPGTSDAKTSCTRRYKALHNTPIFGGEVESIFIPHGSIIFACHKVNPSSRNTTNSSAAMHQLAFASAAYNPQTAPNAYDHTNPYPLPPLSNQVFYTKPYMSQSGQANQQSYPSQRWPQAMPAMSNIRSDSYLPPSQDSSSSWPHPNPPQPSYLDTTTTTTPPDVSYNRPLSPSYTYSPINGEGTVASPTTSDVVPPPRRRISPHSTKDFAGPMRTSSNRPAGILRCSACKATSSPEWRKGPSGKKELCNACGLRYARSRAKKEGQGQRRRKEKPLPKRETATSQVHTTSPYAAVRRNFSDGAFPPSHDMFPPPGGQTAIDKIPSPTTPPSPHMSFVHYAPMSGNRQTYPNATNYYPTSTLPHNSYSAQGSEAHPLPVASNHQTVTQLPPLGQISAYGPRLSPLGPSPSPISNPSPISSVMPMPSMERERGRGREYYD